MNRISVLSLLCVALGVCYAQGNSDEGTVPEALSVLKEVSKVNLQVQVPYHFHMVQLPVTALLVTACTIYANFNKTNLHAHCARFVNSAENS